MVFHPAQHAFACHIAGKPDRAFLYLEPAAVADNSRPITVSLAYDVMLLSCSIGSRCLSRAIERIGVVEQFARRIEEIQIAFRKREIALEMLGMAEFREVRADGGHVDSVCGFRGKH